MRFAFFVLSLALAPLAAAAFYSDSAIEVRASFEHDMIMSGPQPMEPDALWEAKTAALFLTGPMQTEKPHAGPKMDEQLRVLSIEPVDASRQAWRVRVEYRGTLVVDRRRATELKLYWPRDPRSLYRRSLSGSRNPCTDSTFNDDGHFWYFWSPLRSGCRLREGVDYDVVSPRLEMLRDTGGDTLPDYARLPGADGEVRITAVFGADKDELGARPVEGNNDYAAPGYRELRSKLERNGFTKRVVSGAELASRCGREIPRMQQVEEFTRQDAGAKVRVTLLWGTSSVGEHSLPYYCLLDEALRTGSAFIYNGHSGMGASVDLPSLREQFRLPLRFDSSKYQILAFNGCSSYSYYNRDLFREKATASDPAGTANLDVLTNGIVGDFYSMGRTSWKLIEAITAYTQSGEQRTYREIIESMNMDSLLGVNGDEDNPRARR